ncbi:hypothetical protein L3X38_001903 [Prunus dulcis]|uniref:Reverse transcriptase domain-containing protein n=1 Tax=Prunus dulcis TaxID=3755 RepID=A0AAD4WTJ7_PRUDU|nr:hypothetical protein L3X38_001903 [Prunus dulcis]
MSQWQKNLHTCRNHLTDWSKRKFKNNKIEIDSLVDQLNLMQHSWEENTENISRIKTKLNDLWRKEECYWQQRSRIKWLQNGDSNTSYFHQATIQRRRQNKIARIKGENGNWEQSQKGVRRAFEEYFKELFTSSGSRDWNSILNCIEPVVTDDMNRDLTRPTTLEEIKDAAFQMGATKAPGPDGFHGTFYHKYWGIIHNDIQGLTADFFTGQAIPKPLNSTQIVLIPKIPNPEAVSQFRPISLCNFSYKILSKILANRLKPHLPSIISPTQNAFVPDRQIQDNILVAHEVFHALKLKKSKKKFEMGVKLDMNKAYDRVEWDFLEKVMQKMGFNAGWIELVMSCVTTVNFIVVINGQWGGAFSPSRGIQQGDPISPYLFLFISEVLSLLIKNACETDLLQGIKLNSGGPTLSHLLFADDTLIFLKATTQNCHNIYCLLQAFCAASGQQVSLTKSNVVFSSNTPSYVRASMCAILGMPDVTDAGKYLGLPTSWGRAKKEALVYVKDRILRKVHGWNQHCLSQAGREILIKSMALAVPAYPMNIFKFPTTLCKEIDSVLAGFWWGQNGDNRKLHWINWDTLGQPKHERGMGFRNLHEFNLALLAKQCWRILMEPQSLWVKVLKDLNHLQLGNLTALLVKGMIWLLSN